MNSTNQLNHYEKNEQFWYQANYMAFKWLSKHFNLSNTLLNVLFCSYHQIVHSNELNHIHWLINSKW